MGIAKIDGKIERCRQLFMLAEVQDTCKKWSQGWGLGEAGEHDKMWGGTGDLYGNTVAGIWRTPRAVQRYLLKVMEMMDSRPPSAAA